MNDEGEEYNDGSDNVMDEINQQLTEADEYVAKKINRGDNSTVDSSEIPDLITDEIISHPPDDESIDEEMANELDEEAKQSFLENEVFEAIVKFMKTDDLISEKEKEHKETVAPLKKQRTALETFLIDYLEQINQEFIKIGEKTQLTKVETETKGPIKAENVAEALIEGFKKHELYTDEQHDEMLRVVKDMMTIVDAKREKKIKKKISRINLEKEEKKKKAKDAKAKKQAEAQKRSNADSKLDKMEKAVARSKSGSKGNATTKATKATKAAKAGAKKTPKVTKAPKK